MINKSLTSKMIVIFMTLILVMQLNLSPYAIAKDEKDSKQATQSEVNDGLSKINQIISYLTKKIYSASLFSPEDHSMLIDLKDKLIDMWSKNPTNRELAKPMYDTAIILKNRELYDESVDLLNVVVQNFPPGEEEGEEGVANINYSAKAQDMINKINKELESQ